MMPLAVIKPLCPRWKQAAVRTPRLHRRRPGTSCSLLTRHHAQAPAVLDHPRALPQGDGRAGPAFAGGAIGGERNLIVLDAGDVFDDAFAVRCPRIDAARNVTFRPINYPKRYYH